MIIIKFIISALIIYCNSYNKLSTYKIKMDNAFKEIEDNLKLKLDLMNKLYSEIKKVVDKKDYLKGFSTLKNKNLNSYELDKELNEYYATMIKFKEDYKKLNNKEFNDILNELKEIEQNLIAAKKFFNKNNNALMKNLKKQNKIVAKLINIKVKNSYEIKEPVEE